MKTFHVVVKNSNYPIVLAKITAHSPYEALRKYRTYTRDYATEVLVFIRK